MSDSWTRLSSRMPVKSHWRPLGRSLARRTPQRSSAKFPSILGHPGGLYLLLDIDKLTVWRASAPAERSSSSSGLCSRRGRTFLRIWIVRDEPTMVTWRMRVISSDAESCPVQAQQKRPKPATAGHRSPLPMPAENDRARFVTWRDKNHPDQGTAFRPKESDVYKKTWGFQ